MLRHLVSLRSIVILYLVDLLRINLNQTWNLISFIVNNRARLEGIREKLVTSEAALVDDHGTR